MQVWDFRRKGLSTFVVFQILLQKPAYLCNAYSGLLYYIFGDSHLLSSQLDGLGPTVLFGFALGVSRIKDGLAD